MEPEEEFGSIMKEKRNLQKMKKNRILEEERYQQYLKNLYKQSEKEDIQRIIKLNSQKSKKIPIFNKIDKIETKKKSKTQILPKSKSREIKINMSEEKKYSNSICFMRKKNKDVLNVSISSSNSNISMNEEKNGVESITQSRNSWYDNQKDNFDIIEEDINEEDKDEIIFSKKYISYNVSIIVYDQEKSVLFKKNIIIDKNNHYLIDFDKLYNEVVSTLKILNVNCKFGLIYKLNDLELGKKVGKINLLELDLLGKIKSSDTLNKNISLEIEVIDGKNMSDMEALLNPQLHCKMTKHYLLIPNLQFINNCNLFKYKEGLEIMFKYMSVIFTSKKTYDFTGINLDELCYDGDTEIYFDDINFDKKNSSMKKLWDEPISLIYKGIGSLYNDKPIINNILVNYLNKRYFAQFYEVNNGTITLITKFENLFLTEKESKTLYEEFKKNNVFN